MPQCQRPLCLCAFVSSWDWMSGPPVSRTLTAPLECQFHAERRQFALSVHLLNRPPRISCWSIYLGLAQPTLLLRDRAKQSAKYCPSNELCNRRKRDELSFSAIYSWCCFLWHDASVSARVGRPCGIATSHHRFSARLCFRMTATNKAIVLWTRVQTCFVQNVQSGPRFKWKPSQEKLAEASPKEPWLTGDACAITELAAGK